MFLPDDVISLISEYSRPLKRRLVSNYWNTPNITSDTDMLADVISHIAFVLEYHVWFVDAKLRLDIVHDDKITINVWVIDDDHEYLEWKVYLEMIDVLNWNKHDELYHVGLTPFWINPSPYYITQLINDYGKIVKLLNC